MSNSSFNGPKHPQADCEDCPLYKEPYVANELPQGATVAFVGEAPGYREVKEGKPFVGPSGKLLASAAKSAGISDPVAKLNIVACRPPSNRTPTQIEVSRCSKRLIHDLAQLPHLETIVTTGNTPTKHFIGEDKITKARIGQPRSLDYLSTGEPLRIVPTFHPAACLRIGDNYPSMLFDLKKVNNPPPKWEEPEWELLDDPGVAQTWLDHAVLHPSQPVVIDIEVGIEKDTHFGHPEHYQLLCVGIVMNDKVVVIGERALKDYKAVSALAYFVEHHKMICHNGKFDLVLWPDAKLFFDTMLASYVLDERPGTNSLEYNATEILGAPSWKAEVDKYLGPEKNYASIPRDILYKYNAFDIYNTWLLYKYFSSIMSQEERALHDVLCRLSSVLMHAEMKGSAIDLEYLEDLDSRMIVDLKEREEVTSRWVANPRSPKQVMEAFGQLGYKLSSSDEMTLTQLRRRAKPEAVEFIDGMLSYRELQKQHSTYVKGIKKRIHNGRIHPSFLIHGTTTGRLSSRNPNIQNQPRGPLIRRAYIPDPGSVYIQADYATAELRVIAIESGDPYLIEVLADRNRDIHGEVADQFFGVGQWSKDQRVRAKAVVFGLGYGREAASLAREFNISVAVAQAYIDTFFSLIPRVVEWKDELVRRVFKDGWDPRNAFGRTRRFHFITRDNRYDVEKQIYAFIPQSTANDICFRAAIRLWEEHRLDIRILVHDSILVQAHPQEAPEIAFLMRKVMQETAAEEYSDKVPFFVDTEIGPSWGALA